MGCNKFAMKEFETEKYKFRLSKSKHKNIIWVLEIENESEIYTLFLDSNQIQYLLNLIHGKGF